MFSETVFKYPSTQHLIGSQFQVGDHARSAVALDTLVGDVVYEEKVDGANAGFSFNGAGEPRAQSRGHYLDLSSRSVFRERHFNGFKDWLNFHQDVLLERFEDRYLVFGEWMGVVHTVFYDLLPHFFLEFDIFDKVNGVFLDTPSRRALCDGLPIASVPVLYRGPVIDMRHLVDCVRPSVFQSSNWIAGLEYSCSLLGDNFAERLAKMDQTGQSEGIYVKHERDGQTIGRYKFVRASFTQTILDADEHWQSRFPISNLLAGVRDIFPSYLASSSAKISTFYDADQPIGWLP